jgi:hypothetical protein
MGTVDQLSLPVEWSIVIFHVSRTSSKASAPEQGTAEFTLSDRLCSPKEIDHCGLSHEISAGPSQRRDGSSLKLPAGAMN